MNYQSFQSLTDRPFIKDEEELPSALLDFLFKVCPNISALHLERLKSLFRVDDIPSPYIYNYNVRRLPILELPVLFNYLKEHNLIKLE